MSTFKPSSRARGKLAVLEEARRKWDHVHSLVEDLEWRRSTMSVSVRSSASALQTPLGNIMRRIGRAASDLATLLSERGFALLAEDVQQVTLLARGAGPPRKATVYRMKEIIANVYEEIERHERKVLEDDRDDQLMRSLL